MIMGGLVFGFKVVSQTEHLADGSFSDDMDNINLSWNDARKLTLMPVLWCITIALPAMTL